MLTRLRLVLAQRLRALLLCLMSVSCVCVRVCCCVLYVYVMRTPKTYRDECSTHGVALTRTLCTHQLIMFTARLGALPRSLRLA